MGGSGELAADGRGVDRVVGGIRPLLTHDLAPGNVATPPPGPSTAQPEREPRTSLRVRVAWGDLTCLAGDVHVVGHYEDVLPVAAEAALDRAISTGPRGIISEHTRRRWLVGRLGEVTYFPSGHDQVRIAAVAGLGRHGTFTSHRAVQLYTSLLTELSMLGQVRRVVSVLIGSGAGNLTIGQACRAVVDGFSEALPRLPAPHGLEEVVLVEIDRLRAEEVQYELQQLLELKDGARLELADTVEIAPGGTMSYTAAAVYGVMALAKLSAGHGTTPGSDEGTARDRSPAWLDAVDDPLRPMVHGRLRELAEHDVCAIDRMTRPLGQSGVSGAPGPKGGAAQEPVRISILGGQGMLRWAALAQHASVPERQVPRTELFDELVVRLNDPSDADVGRVPQWLSRMVVPADFHTLITDEAPLLLELDRSTAPLHWELMTDLAPGEEDVEPLALRTPIARQLRTGYSRVLIEPAATNRLRALVVGDPGRPPRSSLPGARAEALQVKRLLEDLDVEVTAYVGAPGPDRDEALAGFPAATRLEVLGELLSGGFDLVHYCGHGTIDVADPQRRAGWLFADGLLTAQELAQLVEPPRIVVANACYTAYVDVPSVRDETAAVGTRAYEAALTPGLADEFLRAGVLHYLGTAWQVHDDAGVGFAHTFYAQLLDERASIGHALRAARKQLWGQRAGWGASWAAYQHYGDPTDVLHLQPAPA